MPTPHLSRKSRQESGQTLTEFVMGAALLLAALAGIGAVFHQHWKKTQCAYLTFEFTHARLHHRPQPNRPKDIRIYVSEQSDRFIGEGHCGNQVERVELPVLENASW